jgi:hypothetical protein
MGLDRYAETLVLAKLTSLFVLLFTWRLALASLQVLTDTTPPAPDGD